MNHVSKVLFHNKTFVVFGGSVRLGFGLCWVEEIGPTDNSEIAGRDKCIGLVSAK